MRNISLYWIIIVPFVVQIVGAVGLVGYLSYRSGESAIDQLANQIMQEVGDRIDQSLHSYLRKPTEINQNNAANIKLGMLDWQNLASVEKYFWQQSQIFTDISSLAIATEQKDILIVENLDDSSHVIRLRDQSTNYNWDTYLADAEGKRQHLTRRSATYDPHNDPPHHPWYGQAKNARRAVWRINVSLANPDQPSLIAVNFLPFSDRYNQFQGVLGTAVSLTHLGDLLQRLKIGKTGQAFVIERSGQMIGLSTGEIPFRQGLFAPFTENTAKNVDPNNRRISVLNSQNTLTRIAAQYLIDKFGELDNIKERQQLRFEKEGVHYFVQVLPLKRDISNQDLDWLAVVVIPERDFMTEIQENTNRTFWLCVLTLLVSTGLGLLLARWITTPIMRLGKASEDLVNGDWQALPENIAITELNTLACSFNWMSAQLYQSFDQVNQSLRESEARFFTIFQASPDPAWIATLAEGRCLYVNQSLCHFMEADQNIIIGHTSRELNLWDNLEDLYYYWDVLRREGRIDNFEVVVRTAMRNPKTVLISATCTSLDGQDCVIGMMKDISDRKKTEIELRESQAKLKAAYTEQNILFNAMSDVVLVRNSAGSCIKIAATKDLNLKGKRDEVLSQSIYEELPHNVADIIVNTILSAQKNNQMINCEYKLEIDNHEVWFATSISPLTEDTVLQISRDITERKQFEITLAHAKEVAEAATRAKSEFLANMSQEIRTPMNGVLVMAQLLAATELTSDQRDIVQTIIDSGDILLTIINDILDFSKIESGMLEIEEREFILEDVISSVFSLMHNQAESKQINLSYSIHPHVPNQMIGDSSRLRQILINLVGNAIKFMPRGKVSIGVNAILLADTPKYELRFAITDNGIGIQGDRLTNLFQAFTQADTSISRRFGGTGLGLAISKKLVELMGGTIWVESFGHIGGNPTP
ncbi:MAG: ATP-binding protein, partial [Pseudanabaena sp.]